MEQTSNIKCVLSCLFSDVHRAPHADADCIVWSNVTASNVLKQGSLERDQCLLIKFERFPT